MFLGLSSGVIFIGALNQSGTDSLRFIVSRTCLCLFVTHDTSLAGAAPHLHFVDFIISSSYAKARSVSRVLMIIAR